MQILKLDLHPHDNLHRVFLQVSVWLSGKLRSSDKLMSLFPLDLAQELLKNGSEGCFLIIEMCPCNNYISHVSFSLLTLFQ